MNYYSEAIDILNSVSGSATREHALLVEIAKKQPGAVVNAAKAMDKIRMTAFEREIAELGKTQKINAIKKLRDETGLGLKEAREKVECLVPLAGK